MHKLAGIFAGMTVLAATGCTGVEEDGQHDLAGMPVEDADCAVEGDCGPMLDGPSAVPQPGGGPDQDDADEDEDEDGHDGEVPESCEPVLAQAIVDCADAALDAVDALPEDGVLAPLDALQMCTEPQGLVDVRDALCLVQAQSWCDSDPVAFGEAMSHECFDALEDEFEAPLELEAVELSAQTQADLQVAMQERCPDDLCSVELSAFTYGAQHPTLLETTELVTERVAPELDGVYTHVTEWDLGQDLLALSITEVMESAEADLGLGIHDAPVVGRVFGAVNVAPGVDELTESYTALYREENVVISVTIRQAAD